MMNKNPGKPVHRKVWSPSELALLQRQDPKAFLLAKTHAKLARPSQAPSLVLAHEKRMSHRNKTDYKPFMGAIMGALALAAGVILWPTAMGESAHARPESRVVSLTEPGEKLSPNEQALYWTYALYDFKRLKEEFRVPENTIINHTQARTELASLLPVVDERTRFLVARYRPQEVN